MSKISRKNRALHLKSPLASRKFLSLRIGRSEVEIGYAYWQAPKNSHTAIFFHGFPGDADQGLALQKDLARKGISLIALDRFGYQASSPIYPGRYEHMIKVVEHLVKVYKLNTFSLIGYSGGAPFVLSLASHFGRKVHKVAVVCGLAPIRLSKLRLNHKLGNFLYQTLPPEKLRDQMQKMVDRVPFRESSKLFTLFMPPADRALMQDSQYRTGIFKSISLLKRGGVAGLLFDRSCYEVDWTAAAQKVQLKTKYWHGTADRVLRFDVFKVYQKICPQAHFEKKEREGHFSLPVTVAAEVASWIATDSLQESKLQMRQKSKKPNERSTK